MFLTSNGYKAIIIYDNDLILEQKIESNIISVDTNILPEGWHHIDVYANHFFNYGIADAHISFMLHIIQGQPSVFVPYSTISEARGGNLLNNRAYENRCVDEYSPQKSYFYEKPHDLGTERISQDENGIITYNIDDVGWIYHPVVIIQEALGQYNEYIETGDISYKAQFLNICDWLVDNQENTGAYIYPYSVDIKPTYTLPINFISGMAQGQALSVFARAFIISSDIKYLKAGKECLDFMLRDGFDEVSGTRRDLTDFARGFESLQKYNDNYLFEEYLTNPCFYVLNGDLFAIVGLYDWYKTATEDYGSMEAKKAFEGAVESITFLLPYYDFYGWSCYDLYWHTSGGLESPFFNNSYAHQCHIYLLDFLSQVSDDETISTYYQRFKMYSDDDFWRQSEEILPDHSITITK